MRMGETGGGGLVPCSILLPGLKGSAPDLKKKKKKNVDVVLNKERGGR